CDRQLGGGSFEFGEGASQTAASLSAPSLRRFSNPPKAPEGWRTPGPGGPKRPRISHRDLLSNLPRIICPACIKQNTSHRDDVRRARRRAIASFWIARCAMTRSVDVVFHV